MGFAFVSDDVGVVKFDPASVVRKNTHTKVVVAFGGADLGGGADDVSLKDAFLDVVKGGAEDGVLAVLGPGLGDGFELDVGGGAALGAEVVADGVELGEAECEGAAAVASGVEDALLAESLELGVGDFEVDGDNGGPIGGELHLWDDDGQSALGVIISAVADLCPLDEGVEPLGSYSVYLLGGEVALQVVGGGAVDGVLGRGVDEPLEAFGDGVGDVVGDAWEEADFYDPVKGELGRERLGDEAGFGDAVGELLAEGSALVGPEVGHDGVVPSHGDL